MKTTTFTCICHDFHEDAGSIIFISCVFNKLKANKSDANASCKVLTPDVQPVQNKPTSGEKRKRRKKLFDKDYVTDESVPATGELFLSIRYSKHTYDLFF